MKKALIVALVLLTIVCIAGCKKSDEQKISPQKEPIQTTVEASDNLYVLRLQSVSLSEQALQKAKKPFAAQGSKTYLYVVVTVDGNRMWVSPKQIINTNQLIFEWANDQTSTFAIPWSIDSRLTLQAFVTDDAVEASISAAAAGGVGAAGLGAVIGGIVGCVATLPAGCLGGIVPGAALGAAIGGAAGATGGAIIGGISAKDQLVAEKVFDEKSNFPLDGKVLISSVDGLGGDSSCSIIFKQTQTFSPKQNNELSLQKRYLVRLKEINLSEVAIKKGKTKDEQEYYVILRYGNDKYNYRKGKDALRLAPGRSLNPQIYTIFNNTGEETEIAIYQKNKISDDLVFSSKVARLDGRSWVFQGKAISSDIGDKYSYVVFDTFGPVN